MQNKDSREVRQTLERGRSTLRQRRRGIDREIQAVEDALRALGARRRGRPPKVKEV